MYFVRVSLSHARARARAQRQTFLKRELSIAAVTIAQHANVRRLYLSREPFFPSLPPRSPPPIIPGIRRFHHTRARARARPYTAKAVCIAIPMADGYEILTSRRHLPYVPAFADRLQENYRAVIIINDRRVAACAGFFARARARARRPEAFFRPDTDKTRPRRRDSSPRRRGGRRVTWRLQRPVSFVISGSQ